MSILKFDCNTKDKLGMMQFFSVRPTNLMVVMIWCRVWGSLCQIKLIISASSWFSYKYISPSNYNQTLPLKPVETPTERYTEKVSPTWRTRKENVSSDDVCVCVYPHQPQAVIANKTVKENPNNGFKIE